MQPLLAAGGLLGIRRHLLPCSRISPSSHCKSTTAMLYSWHKYELIMPGDKAREDDLYLVCITTAEPAPRPDLPVSCSIFSTFCPPPTRYLHWAYLLKQVCDICQRASQVPDFATSVPAACTGIQHWLCNR